MSLVYFHRHRYAWFGIGRRLSYRRINTDDDYETLGYAWNEAIGGIGGQYYE